MMTPKEASVEAKRVEVYENLYAEIVHSQEARFMSGLLQIN